MNRDKAAFRFAPRFEPMPGAFSFFLYSIKLYLNIKGRIETIAEKTAIILTQNYRMVCKCKIWSYTNRQKFSIFFTHSCWFKKSEKIQSEMYFWKRDNFVKSFLFRRKFFSDTTTDFLPEYKRTHFFTFTFTFSGKKSLEKWNDVNDRDFCWRLFPKNWSALKIVASMNRLVVLANEVGSLIEFCHQWWQTVVLPLSALQKILCTARTGTHCKYGLSFKTNQ